MTEIVAAHLERAKELIQQWVAAGLSLEDLEVRVAAALAACAREARLEALEEARQLCIAEKDEWRKMDRWLPADAADNCEIHIRGLIEETKAGALERAVGEKGVGHD